MEALRVDAAERTEEGIEMMFGWILCKLKGHMRGVRIGKAPGDDHSIYVFRCPRCSAEWWRKANASKKETQS